MLSQQLLRENSDVENVHLIRMLLEKNPAIAAAIEKEMEGKATSADTSSQEDKGSKSKRGYFNEINSKMVPQARSKRIRKPNLATNS